jgi:hypothetical protein
MSRPLAKVVFALCALIYLLPLTAVLGFKFILLPAAVPNGWPDGFSRQALLVLYFLVYLGCIASTGAAWQLAIGWLARGRGWFVAQPRWLKLAALFAPVCVVASAVKFYFAMHQSHATTDPTLMPAAYWENSLRLAWILVIWSLFFLPPALMATWPRREARA